MLTIKTCTLVGNFVKRIGQTDFRLVKILPNIIFSNRFLEIEGSAKSLLHSAKIKRHDTLMSSAAFCWQGVHHPMSSTLRTGRNKFCCRVEHSRQKLKPSRQVWCGIPCSAKMWDVQAKGCTLSPERDCEVPFWA